MEQCTDVMQGEHRLQIVISFNSFLYIFRALLQSYHFLLIKAKYSADATGFFYIQFCLFNQSDVFISSYVQIRG